MISASILRALAWLVTLPLAVAMLSACGDDDDETVGPEEDTDVEDVAEDEDDLYYEDELDDFDDDELVGETVTVSAQIDRVLEPSKSFMVGEDVVDGGLLVLTPPDTNVSGVTIQEGEDVQVEGEVVEFTVADLEADYDPYDLDDGLYTDYEEENVLIAQSISDAPPEDADGEGADDGGMTTTTAEGTTTTG